MGGTKIYVNAITICMHARIFLFDTDTRQMHHMSSTSLGLQVQYIQSVYMEVHRLNTYRNSKQNPGTDGVVRAQKIGDAGNRTQVGADLKFPRNHAKIP